MNDWFDELQQQLQVAFDRAANDFERQCDAAMESADRWLVETANEVETAATEFVDRAPPEVRQVIDDAEQWLGEWGQAIDRSLDALDALLLDETDSEFRSDRGQQPYADPSDDPNWFVPLSHVRPTPKQQPACQNCQNYHGYRYGENLLVCAIHPYGWDGEGCPDWEGDRP
ncbi:MAG: hypothetical protein ACFB9N_07130 [Geitlerinemataceae cyanobacterium]